MRPDEKNAKNILLAEYFYDVILMYFRHVFRSPVFYESALLGV